MNDQQLETINNITPRGLHINSGAPCECGDVQHTTSKQRKYSDYMVFNHICTECGNQFSTYIEG